MEIFIKEKSRTRKKKSVEKLKKETPLKEKKKKNREKILRSKPKFKFEKRENSEKKVRENR